MSHPRITSFGLRVALGSACLVLLVAGGMLWRARYERSTWNKAVDAYRRADYAAAAADMKKLPVPKQPADLAIYAQTMYASGNVDASKSAYERLAGDSKEPSAQVQLGNIALQRNDSAGAIAAYESVIASNPAYVQAYLNLAAAHRLEGHTDTAVSVLSKGAANNPNATAIYSMLASITEGGPFTAEHAQAVEALRRLDPSNSALTAK